MELKQITSWEDFDSVEDLLRNDEKSWLLESGPITRRIKNIGNFYLELINDSVMNVNKEDADFINSSKKDIRVREVILYCDKHPLVYAKSLLPVETINKGFKPLGSLGKKPLGDILFDKSIFRRDTKVYSAFQGPHSKNYWGRKVKYFANGYPFSVMEIFLIENNNA